MAVQVSYPGVYIEEFTPGAPIEGVGTSTAAFIGVANNGMMDEPTKITSWDRFRNLFGAEPVPGFFLWYAVRGFFENGGQVCYIVRASNGTYGKLPINTTVGAKPLFQFVAREPGASAISVATSPQHLLDNTKTSVFQPTGPLAAAAAIGDKQIVMVLAKANAFRPGDIITIDASGEIFQIVRISNDATNGTLLLDKKLQSAFATGKVVRLANAPAGTRTIRLTSSVPVPPDALVEGAVLTFEQGANKDTQIVASVASEIMSGGATTYRVTLRQGLKFALDMTAAAKVQSEEFKITVAQGGGTTVYERLSVDTVHPRHYLKVINNDPDAVVRIVAEEPPPSIPLPGSLPETKPSTPLAGGVPENLVTLRDSGDQDFIDAIDTLTAIDDVNLIAVPDKITPTVQQHLIAHCELTADRFAVLDCRPGLDLFKTKSSDGIDGQREEVPSTRGYAALYYPWLRVPPAGRGDLALVPPSGHVCGIIARSDLSRGVHKAPANEIVNGALAVERTMSDIDQGQLNMQGINIIRVFQGGSRPLLYGARTTATDKNWQYVNIRRLFLFLEESIQEGIRWAVFEPNNLQLWQKLRRTITEFLTRAWRDGALFGETAEKAFYVRIDEALNPFSEQALGRLHIEIGVRPTYPAEFIIVRIGIWPGGSEVSEG